MDTSWITQLQSLGDSLLHSSDISIYAHASDVQIQCSKYRLLFSLDSLQSMSLVIHVDGVMQKLVCNSWPHPILIFKASTLDLYGMATPTPL